MCKRQILNSRTERKSKSRKRTILRFLVAHVVIRSAICCHLRHGSCFPESHPAVGLRSEEVVIDQAMICGQVEEFKDSGVVTMMIRVDAVDGYKYRMVMVLQCM